MTEMKYAAFGGDVDHYGVLPESAVACWASIKRFQNRQWAAADPDKQRLIDRMGGCLDKLSASMLQVSRLREQHDGFVRAARQLQGQGASAGAWTALEVLSDFEGLLLQGRAALDRLTWFTSTEYKNPTASYRNLQAVLEDFVNDDRAKSILKVLAQSAAWLDAVYAKLDAPQSLRDLVGHKHAVSEGIRNCFTGVVIPGSRVLLLDCEIVLPQLPRPIAVFSSARDSAQHLASIILGTLAHFAETIPIGLGACLPTWQSTSVALSPFLYDEPVGSPLGERPLTYVERMLPDGFRVVTRNVNPSIYDHAI